MPDVIALVGNPRRGSRTATLAAAIAAHAFGGEPVLLDLAETVAIGFGPDAVWPVRARPDARREVESATHLLVATPSYKGTYTGLLKVFLDQFAAGSLAGVIAVPLAIAGSAAHAVTTADDLARLLRELGADVPLTLTAIESELVDADELATRLAGKIVDVVTPASTLSTNSVELPS